MDLTHHKTQNSFEETLFSGIKKVYEYLKFHLDKH